MTAKQERLQVRVQERRLERWRRAAALTGESLSDVVRRLLDTYADHVLAQHPPGFR